MVVGSRRKTEIANRQRKVAGYTLKRVSQEEIAAKLNVNQSTISRDLEDIQGRWLAESTKKLGLIRARELAELDQMEFETAAIIQSLLFDPKRKKTEPIPVQNLNIALRYSEQRLKIKDMRAKQLGLYAPDKLDVNDTTKRTAVPLTPEVVKARHALLKAVANVSSGSDSASSV